MIKKLKTILLVALSILALSACKEDPPRLESAFGIKFGSDIEDVKSEITQKGEFNDKGFVISTNNVPVPNEYFSKYDIWYKNKIYMIVARNNDHFNDKDSAEIFARVEKQLIEEYGLPNIQKSKNQITQKTETDYILKQTEWAIGQDLIVLHLNGKINHANRYYVDIVYKSNLVMQGIDSKLVN